MVGKVTGPRKRKHSVRKPVEDATTPEQASSNAAESPNDSNNNNNIQSPFNTLDNNLFTYTSGLTPAAHAATSMPRGAGTDMSTSNCSPDSGNLSGLSPPGLYPSTSLTTPSDPDYSDFTQQLKQGLFLTASMGPDSGSIQGITLDPSEAWELTRQALGPLADGGPPGSSSSGRYATSDTTDASVLTGATGQQPLLDHGRLVDCLNTLQQLWDQRGTDCSPPDQILATNRGAITTLTDIIGRFGFGCKYPTSLVLCPLILQLVAELYQHMRHEAAQSNNKAASDSMSLIMGDASSRPKFGYGNFEIDHDCQAVLFNAITLKEVDRALRLWERMWQLLDSQQSERCRNKYISQGVMVDSRNILLDIRSNMESMARGDMQKDLRGSVVEQ